MRKKRRNGAENYLQAVPGHADAQLWSEDVNGIVVMHVENRGFFNRLAQKLFHKPRISHIALDRYGTSVWKEMDGRQTIFEIAETMRLQYPEEAHMLERVVTYVATLQKCGFIQIKQ